MAEAVAAPFREPGAAASLSLRRDRDFLRYWAARTVSVSGSAVTYVALPVLVYRLTNSPLWTGLVAVAETVPYLALGLLAGALADRVERRWMMVVADLAGAAVVGSIPLAALLGWLTAVQAVVVAGLAGVLFVFFDAAAFGALPALVGRDRIAAANGWVWGASTVAEIAGPAAAGAALAVLAAPSLMTVDAVSFVVSAALLARITARLSPALDEAGRRPLRQEVADGVAFLWHHPTMRAVTMVGTAQAVAGGAFVGQLVVYADRSLGIHHSDPRLGVLYAGWGVGALAAAMLLPRLAARVPPQRTVMAALPVSAVLSVAVALAPTFAVALPLVVAWGMAYMLVVVNAVTYRQQVTPEALQSRVNTLGRMLSYAFGFPFGAALAGGVAAVAGVRVGLLSACAVTTLLAAAIGIRRAVSLRA